MANSAQTAKIVELALSALAGDNAHHSFEHVCRWIAKKRIASNVLPATGPVSAGGDQGRDFETFHTYLTTELPFSIGFLALAADDTVVFACTIQRDGLPTKIKKDIKSICTQGTPVDRIYIFATEGVATRQRHDLQDWAKAQYSVALDILDGKALSELLAESDLYWVAEHYLSLPPELTHQTQPAEYATGLPPWYIDLRDYWQEPNRQPINLGDLFDLQHGLRHAIRPGPTRPDLEGWLILMSQLAERSPDRETRLYATYEIVAARSQGTADLGPAEALIRQFIVEIVHSDNPTLLFDASVLIQFCSTAAILGHTDIPLPESAGWVPPLRRHVETLLAQESGPNARAGLLQAAAHLALHFDYTGVEPQGTATLNEVDQQYESLMESIDNGTLQVHLETTEPMPPLVDLDAAMRHLVDLVELLPEALTYPIDTFSMTIDVLVPALRDHPLYRQVCDGLDTAIARQEGDAAAGDRCRQRAQALEKAGRPLDALRECHQAKIKWFHGDTLRSTLQAISSVADIYTTLGMYLAAKKYALGMAALARGSADLSDRVFVPIGLFTAAQMDHLAGAWIASAKLATISGQTHTIWAPDAGNLERHAYVTEAMKYQAFTTVIAEQTRPQFVPTIHTILGGSLFDGFTHAHDTSSSATPRTEQEWTDWLCDTAGAPFSDVGPRRIIAFHALGVKWSLHASNNQATVLVLEDFAATLQILLVELASLDPVLIGQDVDIEIREYQPDQRPAETLLTRTHHGQRQWLLFLSTTADADADEASEMHATKNNLSQAFSVIIDLSLLDRDRFRLLMDRAAQNGLLSNLEIGRPYRDLALFRIEPTPPLTDPIHRPLTNTTHPNPRAGAPQMRPRIGPGPGYSIEKAHTILAERYEILPTSIRHTIPELLSHPQVCALFQQLRNEGWKDWHLLNVVANLSINHRLTLRHGSLTSDRVSQLAEAFHAEATREERANDPQISPDAITQDVMEQGIHLVAVSSLHRWELTLRGGTQNPAAITKILGERYGFWDDDMPHPDPFHGQLHVHRHDLESLDSRV